jgi:glutathione S-transferase
VQLVYERTLRPAEKQHQPWVDRVRGQLQTAYRLLEADVAVLRGDWLFGPRPLQADISAAVAWRFTQHAQLERIGPEGIGPEEIALARHPALAALSARAEALPAFVATPLA